jgi:predicted nuclease of predicted toxin-antitoxin system
LRILIDESLPRQLKQMLIGDDAFTVQEMGWAGITNGELLTKAERDFDAFLTADKNLRHQQNVKGLKLVIVVFPSNRLGVVRELSLRLLQALGNAKAGDILEL